LGRERKVPVNSVLDRGPFTRIDTFNYRDESLSEIITIIVLKPYKICAPILKASFQFCNFGRRQRLVKISASPIIVQLSIIMTKKKKKKLNKKLENVVILNILHTNTLNTFKFKSDETYNKIAFFFVYDTV